MSAPELPQQVTREKGLLLWVGALTERAFELSPVWCEYREPWELDVMAALGVSTSWLESNLLDALDDVANEQFWYASTEGSVFKGQSIASAAATLAFGQVGSLRGYLTIVEGAMTSATVFYCDLILSQSDVIDRHNWASLKLLAKKSGKRPWRDLLPVRYRADVDVSPVPREAPLDVALPENA